MISDDGIAGSAWQLRWNRKKREGRCKTGAPGPIRTADTRFRRAVLCPLSYWGAKGIVTPARYGVLPPPDSDLASNTTDKVTSF